MPHRFKTLLLALALDLAFGEPPPDLHPVVWTGRAVAWLRRQAPRHGIASQFAYGVGHVLMVAGLAWLAGRATSGLVRRSPPAAAFVAEAGLLKTTFSLRGLIQAACRVQADLDAGDLAAARVDAHALVGRETAALEAPLLASAAVESVAENASDSVLAPLLYYVLGGLPAALAYRAVNTMDAMVGYREQYEYTGKAAAWADDLLNFAPARLMAGLIVVGAALAGGSPAGAFQTLCRDGGKTASPNAGWPMSAMAGALGVRLEKRGSYRLGWPLPPTDTAAIDHAAQVLIASTIASQLILYGLARWWAGTDRERFGRSQ